MALYLPGDPDAPTDSVASSSTDPNSWQAVPWKSIVGAIGCVLAAVMLVDLVLTAFRVVIWVVVAGFFALVLAPAVRRLEARLGGRRNLATTIVVFSTLFIVIGTLVLFFLPVRTQLLSAITDLPGTIEQAARGRGPVGGLVKKLDLVDFVQSHQADLTKAANSLSLSSVELGQAVLDGVIAFATIAVLTFLFLSQSAAIGNTLLGLLPERWHDSARRAGADASRAVSGYMAGNLFISLIAGTTAFVFLLVTGVPSPVVLALWVAVADLIPLIGAILGAAACVVAAFLHSTPAGIAAVIFFLIYQQIENSVLYPSVMARTVKVNPLVVLLSVLVGVELFGMLGALLAVPLSGAVLVLVKSLREERSRMKLTDGVTTDFTHV